jgi:crossover junction endodeoxyribonuclease RusA
MINLILPYPPSVNHYWGVSGKQRFIGKKGKEFRQAVAEACLDAQKFKRWMGAWQCACCPIWPPDNRKRDVDNTLKPLLDAMEHAGVYENDSQIDELHIIRQGAHEGRFLLRGGDPDLVGVYASFLNCSIPSRMSCFRFRNS